MKPNRGPTVCQTVESKSSVKPGKVTAEDHFGVLAPNGLTDETEMFSDLASGIRHLRYPKVPPDFVGSILKAVESRKMPWWYRLYRWGKSSHSIAVTPFHVLPAAALILVIFVAGFHALKEDSRQVALKQPSNGISVTLSLVHPGARSIHVVGSFNGWGPHKTEMRKDDNGTWRAVLHLPAGRYEYAFLVDGTRIELDPRAEFFQDDCFGNRNNILVVGHSHETAI